MRTLLIAPLILLLHGAIGATSPDGMRQIPPGFFQPFFKGMPATAVRGFYLDRAPVTNQQYLQFVKENPQWKKGSVKRIFADASYLGHWTSADALPEKTNDQPVINVSFFAARAYCASRGMRLPSLAEWEYTASINASNLVNDLPGEIWEWVSDFNSVMLSAESRDNSKDLFCGGAAANAKNSRDYAAYMRYAFRSSLKANYNAANLGFRCARDL